MTPDARLFIERLTLTDFRSHASFEMEVGEGALPIVLLGPNGVGKTNILEALSLLVPGQGLRHAPFSGLARKGGSGGWAVAARVHGRKGAVDLGTGQQPHPEGGQSKGGRQVRINGTPRTPAALAEQVEMVWLSPAQDGLFTGPAAARRQFLDRLTACYATGSAAEAARYARAMQSRNRLLAEGAWPAAQIEGLERVMAEAGVALAAARRAAMAALAARIETYKQTDPASPFPWAEIALKGFAETLLAAHPAVDAEDIFFRELGANRERDRAARRTLCGPHRSDFLVTHGPKGQPAHLCSTGEQKALLLGLILAHAEVLALNHGHAPILLLDEVAAHLDAGRREALFARISALGVQAWMTGTGPAPFAGLRGRAEFRFLKRGHACASLVQMPYIIDKKEEYPPGQDMGNL